MAIWHRREFELVDYSIVMICAKAVWYMYMQVNHMGCGLFRAPDAAGLESYN